MSYLDADLVISPLELLYLRDTILRDETPEVEFPVPQRLSRPPIDFAKAKVKQQLRKSLESL